MLKEVSLIKMKNVDVRENIHTFATRDENKFT
jgi:hypothetical protein